ncbi:putative ribonuclease H-like domain-containing protein [Tanacetum coccineum]
MLAPCRRLIKSCNPESWIICTPTIDLSNSGLEEFQQPEFKGYGPKASKSVCVDTSNEVKKTLDTLLVEEPKAVNTARPNSVVVNTVRANQANAVKASACWGIPPTDDQGYVDSGCSRHMTGNISYLSDFQEFDGGYVTFGGGVRGGKITSKGTLKMGKLDFQDVFFVKELQFNLFSVSQMCDKKNCVLFTDTACFVLSLDFKLPVESQILLKIPRKNNMYSVDMKNIIPKESLTCLVSKATLDESMLWHRGLGHINFKTINKLVKDTLVRGLPSKCFENDQTYVACLKGKQQKASCKSKVQNSITQPLFMLHMDLFGPTFISSLMNKKYYRVVTDDYSRFTWVFFLASKDETSGILKNFIIEIENLIDKKVKIIRCDNGTEFKNRVMNEFCERKGIKREYSVARTPQQNGVAERRNRTLIEATRTMLADSKLPTTFWAEAVNIARYMQNRVLIVKPHNKTPYELFRGRTPALSFIRSFGCHVTILNTLDHLGKFDGKSDDGFFVGYSLISKAFRVYNIRTRKVEENLHIRFLEDKPIVSGDGLKWMFDIDSLTKSMNYVPVIAGTNFNDFASSEVSIGEGTTSKETDTSQDYIVMPPWKDSLLFDSPSMNVSHDEPEPSCNAEKKDDEGVSKASGVDNQERHECSTPNINTDGPSINTASASLRTGSLHINTVSPIVLTTRSNLPQSILDIISLRDNVTPEATNADLFGDEIEMDMSNLNASYHVPTTPNTRIHKDHSLDHVIGDIQSGVQTRRMTKTANEQGLLSVAYERKPHEDLNTCLFFCFLSQEEPKRVTKALSYSAWVKSMQKELLQFKLQKVWVLMDLPKGKRDIGTKWIFKNKKDERARIKAIRLFLAYASFMGFMVYQMDVKSAFLYGQIEKEVYVCQPPGFEDPDYLDKVYKVVKVLYGLHQAPRAWYETLAKYLLDNGFHRRKIDQTLFIKKQKGDILLVQVYMDDIIFGSTKKELCLEFEKLMQMSSMGELSFFLDARTASTPMDTEKPLLKDSDGDDVNVHLYRLMIGSLMYLSSSRPDIMFAVCACARFQVTPKVSHSHVVKRIFRYLKGKPKLGLWYPRDSPFDLVAYSDSDYAGASLDRKSTTGGCQFLGCRLISWQCKKQTVVATSSTKAEYVAAASCCGQVGDEAVHKELGDRMERAATTASSLEAEQDIEIFEQLALMGVCGGCLASVCRLGTIHRWDITRQDAEIPQSQFPTQTQVADEAAFISVDVDARGAATTDIGLEAGQGSGTMHKTPTRPHDSPLPRVHTLRSDEGSLQQNELMDLVTKLTDRVEVLENDTQQTKKVYSSPLTKLILRVKKLEKKVKTNKARRRARIVISKDEDAKEDSSKQGRKIFEIDKDPTISLVQPKQDMEYDFDVSTAEGFTTASVPVTTASATIEVSTAAANLVYIRRKEDKKQLEQERLGHEEAIRLQEQTNEEENQRIAKDAEIAKQLQADFDKARQEQEVVAKADQAHDIDWSDPAVLRYHALQNRSFSVAEVRKNMCMYLKNQGGYKHSHFKGMSYEDIRLIFERVWDQNNYFVPKDSEIEKKVMKRPGFDFQQKSSKKRSREDSNEDNAKKQKLEDDAKKEELRDSMDVVPRDDIAIDIESLATKYPIVDWKTHVLTENMMYYQIIRADGSSKNYKIFSEMLDDFDRQDVLDLHRLVQERYDTTSPEGYDLLLWGDLKILFEPNEEDEIWKNQQDYNLISWRLFDSCGIHMLLMHTGIAIHMMIEKKYHLTQEMLSRMLSRRLEVDQKSEMAFELLMFIRSQL